MASLTPADVVEARRMLAGGETVRMLSILFGVSERTMRRYLSEADADGVMPQQGRKPRGMVVSEEERELVEAYRRLDGRRQQVVLDAIRRGRR